MDNVSDLTISSLSSLVVRLNFLHEISQKISEQKPLPNLLNEIMEESKSIMNAQASSLLLYDEHDKALHFQVATGEKGQLVKKYSLALGDGIAGWVAQNRQSVNIVDCYKDDRFDPQFDKKSDFRTKSMLCVPLERKGKLLGVMQVINKKGGEPFDAQDLNIFETLASQCSIAVENAQLHDYQVQQEAMERELETAKAIQQRLIPETLPEFKDLDIAANLVPAKKVGGDYFDVLKIDDNHTLFVVADVSGKGIPAALIVSTIYSCLRTFINLQKKFDLMDFIKNLNNVLIESTTIDKFATAWFGLYNHAEKKLTSVNAGHNPTLLFSPNKPHKTLEKGGVFLGCLEVTFESETVDLSMDDMVVFYSDGVTEAWNAEEEEYSDERFIDLIKNNQNNSAKELLDKIYSDVAKHVGSAEPSDDITCGVIIFK